MPTISYDKNPLDWTAKGVARVLQNARNLIALRKYEVAFERTMGIDPAVMDQPLEGFYADVHREVDRNFDTYMPNLQVNSVEIVSDGQGAAQLEVDITIE